MDKLSLLAKGWNVTEIEQASKILDDAENDKTNNITTKDKFLVLILISLMLANGFVCSTLLVPFIYSVSIKVILIVAATIGIVFSVLFTILIYDIEKIRQKQETNLFVAYIVNGVINFYLILEFTARFGAQTKLPLESNIYIIAGTYLLAFLAPHIMYRVRNKSEI
ncbi:MAG: hypothetical protein ACP5OA_06265 [Candidatus Woesearchaeota archaeon]